MYRSRCKEKTTRLDKAKVAIISYAVYIDKADDKDRIRGRRRDVTKRKMREKLGTKQKRKLQATDGPNPLTVLQRREPALCDPVQHDVFHPADTLRSN